MFGEWTVKLLNKSLDETYGENGFKARLETHDEEIIISYKGGDILKIREMDGRDEYEVSTLGGYVAFDFIENVEYFLKEQ